MPLDEPGMARMEALGPVRFIIIVSHGDVIDTALANALETAAADYD